MATAKGPKKSAKTKAAAPKAAKSAKPASAQSALIAKVAAALGVTPAQAQQQALAELADRLGVGEAGKKAPAPEVAASKPKATPAVASTGLPRRLYLLLDGRGLDGRGFPIEIIDLPCVLGSGRRNTIWVNAPQIETKHLIISDSDEGAVLEDLSSEHGTFFEGNPIKRRVLQNGDEFMLAGYLRMRAEFH